MNYICTRNKPFFKKIGKYNYIELDEVKLPELIACDTETDSLSPIKGDIFCIQIGTGRNNIIFDLQLHKDPATRITIQEVWPYIKDCTMVFQNACFDLGFFYKYDMWPEKVFDTFLASKILYNGSPPTLRHDFGSLMKRELGITYDKTDQKNINIVQLSQPSTIEYSFNDVDRLLELHEVLVKKLKNYGAMPSYELHCRYIRALAYMEQCGLPLNENMWREKMKKDIEDSFAQQIVIKDYIFDNCEKFRNNQLSLFDTDKKIKVQLSSPQQMIKVFKEFKIPILDKDGKESINEDIIKKSDHEFVKLWLAYQKAEHNVTTFGANVLKFLWEGRLYTRFNPIVDTARISTRRGELNFLNFPANKRTRECFEAKESYKMIVCDYEGQENINLAYLSQDPIMVASVMTGVDLHCALAKVIFPEIAGLTDDDIKKNHKDKRTYAKPIRFAMAYGSSGYTLAINMNCSLEEGNKMEAAFKELHPGIYEWGDKTYADAIRVGYILNADGFKLKLPEFDLFQELGKEMSGYSKDFWELYRDGKNQYLEYWERVDWNKNNPLEKKPEYVIERKASFEHYKKYKGKVREYFVLKSKYYRLCLNAPCQGYGAHMTKRAASLLFEYIVSKGHQWKVRIANLVHDECVIEIDNMLVEEYLPIVSELMKEGANYYLTNTKIKMGAEANANNNWYSAK